MPVSAPDRQPAIKADGAFSRAPESVGSSETDAAAQLQAGRDEIERLAAHIARLDTERDEFLRLLARASSGPPGRSQSRWAAFAEQRPWARRLISRPALTLRLIVTLRKPGFLRVNPLFDAAYYRERYPDVPDGDRRAWLHYRRHGVIEGRDPNPWFDTAWYRERYPDVATGRANPLDHYFHHGWREERDPSQRFDSFDYLRHHPDCVARGMNPLQHFLASEDRALVQLPPSAAQAATPVRASPFRRLLGFYRRHGARRTMGRVSVELRPPRLTPSPMSPGAVLLAEQVHPEAIQAHIDLPVEGSIESTAALVLSGWAVSYAGIESITVYLGSRLVGRATTGQPGPDVATAFPSVTDAMRCGFTLRVPLDDVEPGREILQLIIRDAAGATRVLLRPIERVAPEVAYHEYHERSLPTPEELEAMVRDAERVGQLPAVHLGVIAAGATDRQLRATIRSVEAQSYPALTVTILTDGTLVPRAWALLQEAGADTHRWRVESQVDQVLPGVPMADRFIAFLHAGETLAPGALLAFVAEARSDDVMLVYADHDAVVRTGRHVDPWFLPDWSPDRLLAQDYIGGIYLARDTDALRDAFKEAQPAATGAWRYDLLLRLTDSPCQVRHVSRVLWGAPSRQVPAEEGHAEEAAAVERALTRRGLSAVVETADHGTHPIRRVRWTGTAQPRVSVVIPTTGRPELVSATLAWLGRTDYPDLEIAFLDNSRGANPDGIEELRKHGMVVLERDEPFNWARLSNAGARATSGELLCFLNDDLWAGDLGWLQALVRQMGSPDVAAVGPLLLYPDGRIQHAGIILVDHGGGAIHIFHGSPPESERYLSMDRITRETSALTGACLLVRREAFEALGGFDEALAVIGNDTDLCLRLRRAGYRVLWTPESVLVHREGASRSGISHLPDERRVWDRWSDLLSDGDPYYNPNLARDRVDCSLDWSRVAGRQHPDAKPGRVSGVNLVGYIRAEMGIGEATRGEAQALHDVGIPYVIIDHVAGNPSRMGDTTWVHKVLGHPVHDTNILHINADVMPAALEQLPEGLRDGRRTIGYWTWELPQLPDAWLPALELVDEVWVPSSFVRDAVAARTTLPVHVVPHALRELEGPFLDRDYFGLPDDRYQFLVTYDRHSVRTRKNPEGALAAFRRAFPERSAPVSMVVKVNNADELELRDLDRLIGEDPRIHLINRVLTRHEMDALLACSDALVSLHRSEGFGLHLAEAMSLGKPVIATGWSGNLDFMPPETAYLVSHELVRLERDHGPYAAGQLWAEPDLDAATALMRMLAEDPTAGQETGDRARDHVRSRLAPLVVGQRIAALLNGGPRSS